MEQILILTLCTLSIVNPTLSQDEEERLPPLINKKLEKLVHFRLDDPVFLDCKAEGTEPITYEWEMIEFDDAGNRVVLKKFSEDPGETATLDGSVLSIDPAELPDEGLYQCTASNEHGTTLSNNIYLKRAFIKKPKPTDTQEFTTEEGKPFMIPCSPVKSIPKPVYTWTIKDGRDADALQTSKRIAFDDEGNVHFAHVIPDDEMDGKLYICNHLNTGIDVKMGGPAIKMTVTPTDDAPDFAPELKYSTKQDPDASDNTYKIIAGRAARIQCIFSGKPAPSVSWEFLDANGKRKPIPSILTYDDNGKTALVHNSKNILTEEDPTPEMKGTLKCKGSNELGESTMEIPLEIDYAPRMIVAPSALKVHAGDLAVLVCAADGYPTPDVKWLVNGEEIDTGNPGPRRSLSDDVIDWKPYRADNSKQIIFALDKACNTDDCEGGRDVFSIQCNASNIHGSYMGSGYVSVFGEAEAAPIIDDDPDACKDADDLEGIEKCRATFHANASVNLCLAYCHYNICITELKLDCKPHSIGRLAFCNNYCIREGIFAAASTGEDVAEDDCSKKPYWSPCRKTVLIICIIFVVLPILIAIVVVYKLYQRKKERRKKKKVPTATLR